VARNIRALGGQVVLIGVRGDDSAGLELMDCLTQEEIPSHVLALPGRPTTAKTRIMARMQQVVRVDREDDAPHDAAITAKLLDHIAAELPRCHAVVISDYGKGLVSRAFMVKLLEHVRSDGRNVPVLVDPKPKNIAAYHGVTLLTPNAKETSEATRLPVKTPEQIVIAGRSLMESIGCPYLVTTLGPLGMAVFQSPDDVWHIPTTALQVFDVTGAGDTVIAAMAMGLSAGAPLVQASIFANYAGGIVVGEVGAATATPAQIAHALATLPHPQVRRWE
jgi:rfaE bifunctional protein kinase chain/domain